MTSAVAKGQYYQHRTKEEYAIITALLNGGNTQQRLTTSSTGDAQMAGPNPTGLCQCGCGQPTPRANQSSTKKGWVRGQPIRFISGHHQKFSNLGRKWSATTIAKYRAAKANAPRGPAHHCWKGGLRKTQGRVHEYVDLGRHSNNYVLRARAVMERMLGRSLRKDEHVHHKNGITDDDRPENLEMLSASEHSRRHNAMRVRNPITGRFV